MFKKLNKRIYQLIMMVSAILIVVILVFSYLITAGTLMEVMLSNICNTSERSVLNCQIAINSALNFTKNIARKQTTVDALKSGNYSSTAADLAALQNSSIYISAAILYSANSIAQYTTSTGGVPSLNSLKNNQNLKEFFESDAEEFVCIRKSDIASVYGFNLYNSQDGIISCCIKVFDENGATVGYLFSDILPSMLYKNDFNFFRNSQTKNEAILVTENCLLASHTYFDMSGKVEQYEQLAEESATITDGFALVEIELLNEMKVVFVVSLQNYYTNLAVFAAILLTLMCGLIAASHFVAKSFAQSITTPLNTLYEKMSSQPLPK